MTPEFQDYKLEGTVEDFHACVNDRLFWEVTDGCADITGIGLNYLEPVHEVTFNVPHIVALPGEEISFKCSGAKELLCCYGHCENGLTPEFLEDTRQVKMKLRAFGGEGMRFVGIGESENSRKSLVVSTAPPRLVNRMRKCIFDKAPRHLLFFGDSLTAYDAGRNYTDIAGAFLPESWMRVSAVTICPALPKDFRESPGPTGLSILITSGISALTKFSFSTEPTIRKLRGDMITRFP